MRTTKKYVQQLLSLRYDSKKFMNMLL